MEYPTNPTKRQRERQRAISSVIGGLATPRLDGQEYKPAPYVVEDDHEGFDSDGNYHAIHIDQDWQEYLDYYLGRYD